MNGTRFAKLSFAGVADLDGGFDGAKEPETGVDRPEVLGTLGNRWPDAMVGGFLVSLDELADQLRPFRSSIVVEETRRGGGGVRVRIKRVTEAISCPLPHHQMVEEQWTVRQLSFVCFGHLKFAPGRYVACVAEVWLVINWPWRLVIGSRETVTYFIHLRVDSRCDDPANWDQRTR